MRWSVVVRAWGAARKRLCGSIGVFAAATLAAGVGGCSSTPSKGRFSLASIAAPGSTVAFESIDGPPPEVFNKLVASLNDEAGERKIAVVSRSASASYRIRGYVSATVEGSKTTFAWVWDVYDADKRRALRLSGEELAGPGRRRDAKSAAGAWAAADAEVLRRMARNGMAQMASFLNSPEPPPAVTPEPNLITLASGRDDSPEAAGILRVFRAQDPPPDASAAAAVTDAQPPEPPKTARTRSATAALATDGRATRQ